MPVRDHPRGPHEPSGIPAERAQVTLVGEPVNITYVADPMIGHGQFRLDNHATATLVVAVDSAWLELGSEQRPLPRVTVFDLAQPDMLDPRHFEVAGRSSMTFFLGFPRLAYEPGFGQSAAVVVRLDVNGDILTARSPLTFLRRKPRRP